MDRRSCPLDLWNCCQRSFRGFISAAVFAGLEDFRVLAAFSVAADCPNIAARGGCSHFAGYSPFPVKFSRFFGRNIL
jgi:hypothetical protein